MLRRWITKIFRNELQQNHLSNQLQDYHLGVVTIFKIDNGFILQITNPNTGRSPKFTYCADYKAISDFFVALAAKDKLGIQPDLFD